MDLVALAAELTAGHPVTGAYNADDALATQQINEVNIDVIRASMSGSEMFANTDGGDYAALSDAKKLEWLNFCGIDSHNPNNGSPAATFVTYIFGAGTQTLTNLIAARGETISRATQLGLGRVRVDDVTKARAL